METLFQKEMVMETVHVTIHRNPNGVTFRGRMALATPRGPASTLGACLVFFGKQRGATLIHSNNAEVKLGYETEFWRTVVEQFVRNVCDDFDAKVFKIHFEL